jgi:hypothetical protein
MRILITLLCIILYNGAFAQSSITGLWYSKDSSRVYKVDTAGNSYGAILHFSSRSGEQQGALVLSQVKKHPKKNKYTGIIRAVSDGMPVPVTIRMSENGNTLSLKLHRLFMLPVNIRWYRALTVAAEKPAVL